MPRLLIAIVLASGLAPWHPAVAEPAAGQAVGRLLVKGQASLEGPSGAIELVDTTHPYFAGDRVVAGPDGAVVLSLAGGAVTIEPGAAAHARMAGSIPHVALDRGTARVQFPPGRSFELALGDLQVRPQADAGDVAATDVLASFDPRKGAVVGSHSGALAVLGTQAVAAEPIHAGETRGFPLESRTQLPAVSAPSDETGLREQIQNIAMRIGGAAGLGGLGYGAYELAEDDDDASPTQ